MGRSTKEESLRLEGVGYALRFLKSHSGDIEALEKDYKSRGGRDSLPIGIDARQAHEYSDRVKSQTIDTMRIACLISLRDEFDFGGVRLRRFIEMFDKRVDGLLDGTFTWDNYKDLIEKECGIELPDIRWNR